jgi:2TM domain
MPPLWPRQPDRRDPDFRRFGDRLNFAFHVAVFCAGNSFLWFLAALKGWSDPRLAQLTTTWAIGVVVHGVYVFKIATYPGAVGTKALKKKDLKETGYRLATDGVETEKATDEETDQVT